MAKGYPTKKSDMNLQQFGGEKKTKGADKMLPQHGGERVGSLKVKSDMNLPQHGGERC